MSKLSLAMGHEALQRARAAKNLSRNQLARLTGLAPQTIYTLESSGTAPSLDTARRLAEALGCTVDDIFPPLVEADDVPSAEATR